MTQTVYGLISDSGDGSGTIQWFRDKELVDSRLTDDENNEQYYANEGRAKVLTFPDDLDLEKCGFRFSDKYYRSQQ